MMKYQFAAATALLCILTGLPVYSGDVFPTSLQCEYKTEPLGIDVAQPRLTWTLEQSDPASRGKAQTAYQILVTDSMEFSAKDEGNLWDSGKVTSSETSNVEYAGKPLKSDQDCFWKVRVWDQDGKASDWSRPARWSMGLLGSEDWKASWIEAPFRNDFNRCTWIWSQEEKALQKAPAGTRYFRKTFTLDADAKDTFALITADDQFTLFLDGKEILAGPTEKDAWKKPQRLHSFAVSGGKHVLSVRAKNLDDSPAGLTGKFCFLVNDTQQIILTDASWKVSGEEKDNWNTVDFNDADWKNAKALARVGEQSTQWGVPGDEDGFILTPPAYFTKNLKIDKPVKRAMVYASARGIFELNLNGNKIGDEFFRPGWSDFRFRLQYNTYDITSLLKSGENTVTAIVADGWYSGYIGWGKKRNFYEGEDALRAQFNVEYTDGTTAVFGTDSTWQVLKETSIREADMLHGETYDARQEAKQAVDKNAAISAVQQQPGVTFEAYPGNNVVAVEEIKPIRISEPKPGVFIYDLGQNMVGFVRLKVQGPAGTAVRLRFNEMLQDDGTLYLTNLRTARATDTYILKGEGVEIWQPKFTFHGFRYIEVTGYPGHPDLDSVTGVVLHTKLPNAGTFECSDSMVNQLVHNIEWGMRGNYLELPTDCPQRDERMGWMGDAQVFVRTGTYFKDTSAFFTKWLQDVMDTQHENGAFTDVSPDVTGGGGTAAWADAGVVCPYTMYLVYGDTRILEKHYANMQRYIEYLKTHSKDLIRPKEGYGDWLSLNANTPQDLLGTAYFAYSTRLMSKIATAINKPQDAEMYEKLYTDIRTAFIKRFMRGDTLEGNTQTDYVLAIKNDLIPPERWSGAVANLVRDLMVRDYHFSTGFAGLSDLLPMLTKVNRLDLAYKLLLNDTFPSWGFEIKNGATTIWERWDGWTPEFGFQDPGMNSFNHYAFGAVGEWIYSTVGGIDTLEPGYKKIQIYPRPGGDLRYAKASYNSIRGWITSEWSDKDDAFRLTVRIPANTTAIVHVKARNQESVTENGKQADKQNGIRFVEMNDGFAVYEVSSGSYSFVSQK